MKKHVLRHGSFVQCPAVDCAERWGRLVGVYAPFSVEVLAPAAVRLRSEEGDSYLASGTGDLLAELEVNALGWIRAGRVRRSAWRVLDVALDLVLAKVPLGADVSLIARALAGEVPLADLSLDLVVPLVSGSHGGLRALEASVSLIGVKSP